MNGKADPNESIIPLINAPPNPIFDSPLPQKFSIPPTFIYYIAKSSKSLNIYQTCKYFYSKYSFVAFHHLHFTDYDSIWRVISIHDPSFNRVIYKFHLPEMKYKIWLNTDLWVLHYHSNSNIVSSLCKKIWRCDITFLWLMRQIITFNDFLLLTSSKNLKHIKFEEVIVNNNDGSVVQLETIIANLPKIEWIEYEGYLNSSMNFNTAKAIAEFPRYENLRALSIWDAPDGFDLESFSVFMKKHPKTSFQFRFRKDLSPNYLVEVCNFAEKMIKTRFIPPPIIEFRERNERYEDLWMRHHRYFQQP